MSLAVTVTAMAEAGCSAEQIAAVVRAHEANQLEFRSSAAVRQARYRDKKRNEGITERNEGITERNVTRHTVSPSPFPPDPPPHTPPPITPQTSPPSISPIARARGVASRLAIDFEPSESMRAYGLKHGLSHAVIDTEGKALRDWSLSSPNGVKLDWEATWRTWIRRRIAAEPRAGPNGHKPKSRNESFLRLLKDDDEPSGLDNEENGRTIDLGSEEFSRSDGYPAQRR